jgi:hypothetical protein
VLRTLNRYALIGSSLLLLVAFWNRNALPAGIAFVPALEDEPKQRKVEERPFSVSYEGVEYSVDPQYAYELYGMVVSYRQHDGESTMHRRTNDHLNVADVCVVWSDTAMSPHLAKIDFWNGIFTCNFETRDDVAWAHFKTNQLSNNHLLSADVATRERIDDIRIGDQIRIKGQLASYGAVGGPVRGTSTTREDTGNGACETIFVDEFEIIAPAFSGWRATMHASLAVLALCLILHFAMPHRARD